MKYKAIALDLDGTLTDSNKNLSEGNICAIHKIIDKGVKVILASGRPVIGIEHIARKLELDKRGGYILAYNGGNIIDCKTNELIYEKGMPDNVIHTICKEARANGVVALTYDGDYIIAENIEDEYVIKEAVCNSAELKKINNLEAHVTYTVAKFLVVGEHEKLLKVQKQILDKCQGIDAFFSESYFLEVVPMGIAKDKSLERLLEKLNIKKEELVACGDGMNDIPMLKYAGLAVVMENAYEEVKKYADYITCSNDEDGVARAIEKFFVE